MDLEPRVPRDEELPKLVEFLTKHLRPTENWPISAEYPLVFNQSNRQNLRAIFDGENIVAHAAIKYMIIKNTVGLFKVAAIGSVVTAPEYRNQGLSQKILKSCLDSAHDEGADFAILWTDLYDFYRKLDFELAGIEIGAVIERELDVPQNNLRFLCSEKIDPSALLQIYTRHTVGSIRSLEEVKKCLAIPNARVYTAWDNQNLLKAYAIEGKGADLKGYVHEWGGNVPELMALFSHIRKAHNAPITIIMPSVSQNLLRELQKHQVTINEGYLGMIRPLRLENLISKLHRHARSMGITDFVFNKNADGSFTIGRGDLIFSTSDLKTLTRVLFGPYDSTSDVSKLNPILPIPMWIWGWDSA